MPNLETIDLPSPLAVVCHDAGATNLIIGWLKNRKDLMIRTCLCGPAIALWSEAFPNWKNESLPDVLDGAAALISGTGWASDIEHSARRLACVKGVYSIGVIDHWVNYRERFVRNDEQVLPDELWVTDEDALAEAQRCFPECSIRQLPNMYLESLLQEVAAYRPLFAANRPTHILYVLEPIHQKWSSDERPGEFQALEFFLERLGLLGLGADAEIHLRPHPSEPAGKYDSWCVSQTEYNLTIDVTSSLAEAIGWADWVVGCESFALVAALYANRCVVSTLPPWAPHCRLPQNAILHLRDMGNSSE